MSLNLKISKPIEQPSSIETKSTKPRLNKNMAVDQAIAALRKIGPVAAREGFYFGFFAEKDLRGKDLSGLNLSDFDLSGANLSGANLTNADLSFSSLLYVNLQGAKLGGANLYYADLSGADLIGAFFNNKTNVQCVLYDNNSKYGENWRGKFQSTFTRQKVDDGCQPPGWPFGGDGC